jgi:hypothetical protein
MVDQVSIVLLHIFPISNLLFRKVFGKNHREDLTPEVISKMSVTALAEQRKALEDAFFDSE